MPTLSLRLRILPLIAFLSTSRAEAQTGGQWGALVPGRYQVGYRTLHLTDSSRRSLDRARTLQVYIWYPAAPAAATTPMPYEGYFDDAARDWGDDAGHVAFLRRWTRGGFQSGALNPSFSTPLSPARFDTILATPTRVVRDASAAAGRYPILLHAHSSGVLHQSLTMEYLASHGYLVMSVSMYNSAPAFYGRGEDSPNALYQMAEDFARMLVEARRMPNADAQRVAAVGMMAQAGLALQMKASPLRAIACLECLDYKEKLERLPYFDSLAVRIPLLELINSTWEDATTDQRRSYLDRFPASTRYVGRFSSLDHADFYPFPKIAVPGTSHEKYEAILYTTLQFLNAMLRDDANGRRFLENAGPVPGAASDFLRIRVSPPRSIPTEAEVLGWVRYGQVGRAREAIRTFGSTLVTRSSLFTTVLFLARDGEQHADSAVALFRSTFPAAPNSNEARQDEMLTRLLARRPSVRPP